MNADTKPSALMTLDITDREIQVLVFLLEMSRHTAEMLNGEPRTRMLSYVEAIEDVLARAGVAARPMAGATMQ